MHSFSVILLLGCSLILFSTIELTLAKNWAVILVGYDWYVYTYAFEAGAYKQYNDLVQNGVDPENIIVISPDSAAFHKENPMPGLIAYGYEKGEFSADYPINQYENIPIDYVSKNLEPEDFFDILAGRESANLSAIGTGKVLKTGPNDNVFLYIHTFALYIFDPFHWYIPTIFYLNNWDLLFPQEFIPVIEELAAAKHFKNMFIQMHSTASGSMFDNYLETNLGIIAYSLGGRYHTYEMCHWNNYTNCYTSTCPGYEHFAYLDKASAKNGAKETILDLYAGSGLTGYDEDVVHNLYGDFDVTEKPIKEFYGPKMKNSQSLTAAEIMKLKKDVREQTEDRSESISEMLINETPLREQKKIKNIVNNIITESIRNTGFQRDTIDEPIKEQFLLVQIDCIRSTVKTIRSSCLSEKGQYIIFRHGHEFAKLCSLNIPKEKIISAIGNAC